MKAIGFSYILSNYSQAKLQDFTCRHMYFNPKHSVLISTCICILVQSFQRKSSPVFPNLSLFSSTAFSSWSGMKMVAMILKMIFAYMHLYMIKGNVWFWFSWLWQSCLRNCVSKFFNWPTSFSCFFSSRPSWELTLQASWWWVWSWMSLHVYSFQN